MLKDILILASIIIIASIEVEASGKVIKDFWHINHYSQVNAND